MPNIAEQLDMKKDDLLVPEGSADQFKKYLTELREKYETVSVYIPPDKKMSCVEKILSKIEQQHSNVKCKIDTSDHVAYFKALNFHHSNNAKYQFECYLGLKDDISNSEDQFNTSNEKSSEVQRSNTPASSPYLAQARKESVGPSSKKYEDICCFETEYGLLIKVYEGDILNVDVDGIVCTTDSDLKPLGELAKVIIDAAGDAVYRDMQVKLKGKILHFGEVLSTLAGNLKRYKNIIHAVIPVYTKTYDDYGYKKILMAIYNSLREANQLGLSSVALSVLSSGKCISCNISTVINSIFMYL